MDDVKIEGMEEILKKLNKLPEKIMENVMTSAIRAGAKSIVTEAKRNVPSQYGELKESIGIKKASKPKVYRKTLKIFKISPMKKTITKKGIRGEVDGWYARFLEFGTYAHLDHPMKKQRTGKLGKKRAAIVAKGGGIRPHPFMRIAYEKEGMNAIKVIREYMKKRIDKELAKL